MKKYRVYAGMDFYPKGGIKDFLLYVESVDKTISYMETQKDEFDWYCIVRISDDEIVVEGNIHSFITPEFEKTRRWDLEYIEKEEHKISEK